MRHTHTHMHTHTHTHTRARARQVCNIYFLKACALGGHRAFSREHKLRLEAFSSSSSSTTTFAFPTASPDEAQAGASASSMEERIESGSRALLTREEQNRSPRRKRFQSMKVMEGFDEVRGEREELSQENVCMCMCVCVCVCTRALVCVCV